VLAALLAGLLGGCGQMGPLSLPEAEAGPAAQPEPDTAAGSSETAAAGDEDEDSVDGNGGDERPE
jgi:predicted small lipoprotein YifL